MDTLDHTVLTDLIVLEQLCGVIRYFTRCFGQPAVRQARLELVPDEV